MKTVPLRGKKAAGRVARVDDEDYGLASMHKLHVLVKNDRTVYAYANIQRDGKWTTISLHRLLMPGVPEIHHLDGDGLNCTRANMVPATRAQNNYARRCESRSKFTGVTWNARQGRWFARIRLDGRSTYLGWFRNETDAAMAWDIAAWLRDPVFWRPNLTWMPGQIEEAARIVSALRPENRRLVYGALGDLYQVA